MENQKRKVSLILHRRKSKIVPGLFLFSMSTTSQIYDTRFRWMKIKRRRKESGNDDNLMIEKKREDDPVLKRSGKDCSVRIVQEENYLFLRGETREVWVSSQNLPARQRDRRKRRGKRKRREEIRYRSELAFQQERTSLRLGLTSEKVQTHLSSSDPASLSESWEVQSGREDVSQTEGHHRRDPTLSVFQSPTSSLWHHVLFHGSSW